MIEISPEIITAIMLGGVVVGVLTGFPLAIVVGALAIIAGYSVWGANVGVVFYKRLYDIVTSYIIVAVPLFIFMGNMLGYSGVTEKLYEALYLWLGGLRGGLAISTMLIGTILAATVGVISASVAMLSLVALPSMIKRGYSKSLAAGTVCAGGTLGILIPPSIMLVIYGPMAEISVGKLFMAAFPAGLVLSGLYCVYIALRCLVQPHIGPAVPPEERTAVPFIKKTTMLLTSLIPPVVLVLGVLGVIFLGIATPTEASGVGAFVAMLLVLVYRRLNWQVLKETALGTLKLSGIIMFIGIMANAFTGVFLGAGGGFVIKDFIVATPGGHWGVFALIMFIVFILGMFIDWLGIVFIIVPIVTPIVSALAFDPLWFAMMIIVNLQTSFMTPPFAYAIFVCRGTAPPELGVTTDDIIRGVIPFVLLILVGLGLFVAFPEIILWLPSVMIK